VTLFSLFDEAHMDLDDDIHFYEEDYMCLGQITYSDEELMLLEYQREAAQEANSAKPNYQ